MNWGLIIAVILAVVLMRAFLLRIKANSMKSESFKALAPKDKLAVLKECLLNNPTEYNLQNLAEFCKEQQISVDAESYRPYLKKQLEITQKKNAIAEDNELFHQESIWMDQVEPLEFREAAEALSEGDKSRAIERAIEGISRLYSDEAIEKALQNLQGDYPKAADLLTAYKKLAEIRDESGADDESLEKLRKMRDAWHESLLTIE